MESALGPVQTAIHAILVGDAALLALVGNAEAICDAMPENSGFLKVVVIGEATEVPNNTLGGDGRSERLSIHSITEDTQIASGWKVAQAINARVNALLDGAELSVAGLEAILCHFENAVEINDPPWRQIVSDFRIETEAP